MITENEKNTTVLFNTVVGKPKCCGTFDCYHRDNKTWECYKSTKCVSQKSQFELKVIN